MVVISSKAALNGSLSVCGSKSHTIRAVILSGHTVITGGEQIRRRPVLELAEQLKQLGADVIITRPGNQCPRWWWQGGAFPPSPMPPQAPESSATA